VYPRYLILQNRIYVLNDQNLTKSGKISIFPDIVIELLEDKPSIYMIYCMSRKEAKILTGVRIEVILSSPTTNPF
jgi:hypothetical protein